jgi:RNA polymerase sigma-70 factor (ECF subfamily)
MGTVRSGLADAASLYDELDRGNRVRITRLCGVLLADPDEAADAVQDAFRKLHAALGTETRAMDWAAWLTRVAVNTCRDRQRSGWWGWCRQRGVSIDEASLPAAVRSPEDEVIGREVLRCVWDAIRRLPPRQREVFALRQLEGFSVDEAAAALGIGAGSVKQHLFRAVRSLRRAIGGDA